MLKTIHHRQLNSIDRILIMKALDYMDMSNATKRKVGAVIGNHTNGKLLTFGYNKMFDNIWNEQCEDSSGETIPYVIHAEESAIISYYKSQKLHDSQINISELTMYVSYSPCINCCKMIAHLGIKRILFVEKHSVNFDKCHWAPIDFLTKMGIEVYHVLISEVPEILEKSTK